MNNIRVLSWNVNGVSNVKNSPPALKFAVTHEIILLQETFELKSRFHPSGYIKFNNFARPTGGRPSGGLTTLISQKFCGNSSINRLACAVDWLLPLRIVKKKLRPFILLNVYIPRFSNDFGVGDVNFLADFVSSLRQNYPGHSLILG